MPTFVHYIPILTTVFAACFAPIVFRRWQARKPAPHLFWWALGIALYGVGTFTEGFTTLFGWNETVFRSWYISGALLGGWPLALPGIGGAATRMGHTEVLYVMELIGITLIWIGYTYNVKPSLLGRIRFARTPYLPDAALLLLAQLQPFERVGPTELVPGPTG